MTPKFAQFIQFNKKWVSFFTKIFCLSTMIIMMFGLQLTANAQTEPKTTKPKTEATTGDKVIFDANSDNLGRGNPAGESGGIAPLSACEIVGGCMKGIDSYDTGDTGGIFKIIQNGINSAMYVAVPTAIIFIVVGGYMMITSQGDEKKYSTGMTTLQYSIIGLTIVILSATIVLLITGVLTNTNIGDSSDTTSQQSPNKPKPDNSTLNTDVIESTVGCDPRNSKSIC